MSKDQDHEREQRFTHWAGEHRGIFFKIARAYASTAGDQAELYQEMLVQLWRSLAGFRGQCGASTWIYRVCLNTALTWQRGERKRAARFGSEHAIALAESSEPRPGWTQEESELLTRLYEAVRLLPEGERTVVVLSLDGLSYREICEITGLTENHVGVPLNRARRKLAEMMKEVRHEL